MFFLSKLTKRDFLTYPPATAGLRPEKVDRNLSVIDKLVGFCVGSANRLVHRFSDKKLRVILPFVKKNSDKFTNLTDGEIKDEASRLRMELYSQGMTVELVGECFALVQEVSKRKLGMRHFDSQLMGGWVMLQGMIAEMETGEGKTLTATLTAATAALAGVPVHVISVNDYLTERDAEQMRPIYEALGLTVGCVVNSVEPGDRRSQYECDITYCTNKELTFDYLRDGMALGLCSDPLNLQAERLYEKNTREDNFRLRGLHFAIVDEADSILIDESRTPLIISGLNSKGEEEVFFRQAYELALKLELDKDFLFDKDARMIALTEEGRENTKELSLPLGALWTGTIRREDIVTKALTGQYVFNKDEHYLVDEKKVQIIDEFTGRVMKDRSWNKGLQQLIEIKEGCDITQERETVAKISYQRFFRRYLHMAGMTGTAREVERELWTFYGMAVVNIKTNRPLERVAYSDKISRTLNEKWRTVVDTVKKLNDEGRPVLIGVRTITVSESLSELLKSRGLKHNVLNAKNDKEEADIISLAGEKGCITIATNMAGRGTDIKLLSGVSQLGGLHVIITERHEAARIDRQLAGRCARQGDPGSFEAILSFEDPILEGGRAGILGWLAEKVLADDNKLWRLAAKFAILRAQKKVEKTHALMRKDLYTQDKEMGTLLSFSGRKN